MTKNKRKIFGKPPGKKAVGSLLDNIVEGREYGSLVDLVPENLNLRDEMRRGIAEVETVRQRPLLIYAGNMARSVANIPASIVLSDDLPFSEMVGLVDPKIKAVDLLIATPGGLGQQVSQFVNRLRPRFDDVAFLIPHIAMSAGTIWALSGNEIWMDERASLGPIDPQVPGKDGQLLPAQALLALVKEIQERGQKALTGGQNPDWTDVQLLRSIDPKELGNVLALTRYSIQLAATYLETYKFQGWTEHRDGRPVTQADRTQRASQVATMLCSHEQWKVHSHGISREVAERELRIKISKPEDILGLNKSLRRLWAVVYYCFENTNIGKIFLSTEYSFFRVGQK